jgi:T-complex protein 1 subunit theta
VRSDHAEDVAGLMRVDSHLEKHFVTSDAATIVRELEVVHPAAKVLVLASQQQESEVSGNMAASTDELIPGQIGDRTNLVLIIAGELLKSAEQLLNLGLHPSEIIAGYELARDKVLEELESASSAVALPSA